MLSSFCSWPVFSGQDGTQVQHTPKLAPPPPPSAVSLFITARWLDYLNYFRGWHRRIIGTSNASRWHLLWAEGPRCANGHRAQESPRQATKYQEKHHPTSTISTNIIFVEFLTLSHELPPDILQNAQLPVSARGTQLGHEAYYKFFKDAFDSIRAREN
jgi:hypothetical protein